MMQFGSIAIYVADVDKTVAYYRDAFGIEASHRDPAGDFADLETGDTTITFVNERMERTEHLGLKPNRLGGNATGVFLVLYTGDVDAAYARAIAVPGGENASEPYDKPSGERAACVRDPNGIIVELTTLPPHRREVANALAENTNLAVEIG